MTCYLLFSLATAVIGSLQFGYNTGVINAPEQVNMSLRSFQTFFFKYMEVLNDFVHNYVDMINICNQIGTACNMVPKTFVFCFICFNFTTNNECFPLIRFCFCKLPGHGLRVGTKWQSAYVQSCGWAKEADWLWVSVQADLKYHWIYINVLTILLIPLFWELCLSSHYRHRMPKEQWWLGLRLMLKMLAKYQTSFDQYVTGEIRHVTRRSLSEDPGF